MRDQTLGVAHEKCNRKKNPMPSRSSPGNGNKADIPPLRRSNAVFINEADVDKSTSGDLESDHPAVAEAVCKCRAGIDFQIDTIRILLKRSVTGTASSMRLDREFQAALMELQELLYDLGNISPRAFALVKSDPAVWPFVKTYMSTEYYSAFDDKKDFWNL